MPDKRDDGGPAFPVDARSRFLGSDREELAGDPGMTLRDWLAGQALVGIMTGFGNTDSAIALKTSADARDLRPRAFVAGWAYEIADAMLTERAKVAERNVCGEDCPDCMDAAERVAAKPTPASCGDRDHFSPRVCDLPPGHDGAHDDSTLPTGATERAKGGEQ